MQARAATLAHTDEELSQPVLSYDQNPSRIAWRILAKSASGANRPLFVAGTAVYEGRADQLILWNPGQLSTRAVPQNTDAIGIDDVDCVGRNLDQVPIFLFALAQFRLRRFALGHIA